ncbi:electron transfer flavoprotein subunit alpha/FixB family protein [Empedobacter falsenii]|uniref:Electron transfer flavoprotein subunit alpha n=1 Tax=Empedobacter falsenii TaxID=343874 RepID=A0A3R8Z8F2_9FLAO|nr:electron transfer flavoprotein subunit alpha/FixB family protein [Empedobacter falsenii]RRT91724.1 electron transfer flavoprotein subunit alpha/FixB family protein [Empedobacter falsenii]RRT91953.1 electron transfer flavoprotein subunit alpha/FixB family protein [Empedobacter falsenii]
MAIFVYAESHDGKYKKAGLEAVSYAKATADVAGDTVTAIVFGNATADELYKYGASKVVKVDNAALAKFDANSYAKALAEVAQGDVVVLPSTNEGATIAPVLAYKTGASLVTNVEKSPTAVSPFTVARKAFSGKGVETVAVSGKVVVTVLQNAFGAKENVVSGSEESASVSVSDADAKVKVVSTEMASSDKIDLKEADIVVSAGRGMKGPENWGMIEDLAKVLGAATASSKPVADIGWRPHAEHVGQTGKAIAPNLYIAVGISGAIQHLAGVNGSKTIVVINNDPEAPFFKAADYGIVGDAFEIVPKLTEELKKYKGQA